MLRVLIAALLIAWAGVLQAQEKDPATLVADRVFLNNDDTLTAEGSVEVFYGEARLSASRIVYRSGEETLQIEGPIRLYDGKDIVILASAAELSRDLRDGIMQSARMVMRDQLQLAANELRRVGGRYTQLTRVAASSCQVCAANPVPLWEIRASSVVHDEVTQRLYFSNAQLRLMGLPVAYLPRLRLPEPGVERATGFLVPSIRSTSQLGTGLRLRYFIALGDSRDLTITPYVSTSSTRTVDLRYRQAFRTGRVEFNGALSSDDLRAGSRGYLFGTGTFGLPKGYRLDFNIETVSDPAYLLDYDISGKDRLASFVTVERTQRDERIEAKATRYETIRANESNATLPTLVGDLSYGRRFDGPAALGGVVEVGLGLHGHRRDSTSLADADGDGISDGRDLGRASAAVSWQGSAVLPGGILGSATAALDATYFAVGNDATTAPTVMRIVPTLAAELRWPLMRAARDGATDVVEPVAQLVWSPDKSGRVPNEDSRLVEFDEANLFSLNRFPGSDQKEQGLRANLGVGWTRLEADGRSFGIVAGQVLRLEDPGLFSAGTGLSGVRSDWLLAAHYQGPEGLDLMNRILIDEDMSITQNELRLRYGGERFDLGASFIWQVADPVQDRPIPTRQLTLNTGWTFAEGWTGTAGTRYDLQADKATKASVGLQFRNECTELDLSLSRRFTSSTSVDPVTDFNFQVTLNGFGQRARGQSFRQSCGG